MKTTLPILCLLLLLKSMDYCAVPSNTATLVVQKLFSSTRKSLTEEKISVSELVYHLQCLGPIKPTYTDTGLPPLRHQLPGLANAKSIDAVMSVVKDYCSFFNYHMIEHIINKLGTPQDKTNLAEYKKHFESYADNYVIKCPLEVGEMIGEGQANMYVTLDDSFDNCTPSHISIFKSDLRTILEIESDIELYLYYINLGSIKLTFQIPILIQQAIFPLSSEQEEALKGLGVVQLSSGDYQFPRNDNEPRSKRAKLALPPLHYKYVQEVDDPTTDGDSVRVVWTAPSTKSKCTYQVESEDHDEGFEKSTTNKSEDKEGEAIGCKNQDKVKVQQKSVKSSPITDPDRLFNDLAFTIYDKYIEIGTELGLQSKVLSNELETGEFKMLQGSKKARKMLQLWRDSVSEDKCTYRRAAHEHCYSVGSIGGAAVDKSEDNFSTVSDSGHGTMSCASSDTGSEERRLLDLEIEQLLKQVSGHLYDKLHRSSYLGDLEEVKQLVEGKQLNPLGQKTEEGMNALHHAAAGGQLGVMKYFTNQKGYNPAIPSIKGLTCLHYAAQHNHYDLVRYLVDKQTMELECRTELGDTPLHLACAAGNTTIVAYLINEMSKYLQDVKVVSSCKGEGGWSPLHYAAYYGKLEIIEQLISKFNSDPLMTDDNGRIALHLAAQQGHLHIVKFLAEQIENVSCMDKNKATPLNLAAQQKHVEVVRYLTMKSSP